jgi:threonyl-tRNA synthetase
MQLWETSGHAANYKDNMFVFEVRTFADTAEIFVML